jgi:hypothetical protein
MKSVLIASLATLAGCAQLPQTSCANTNWYSLGEQEGLAGLQARIDTYEYHCAKQNVAVSRDDYHNGWWVGNATYRDRTAGSEGS